MIFLTLITLLSSIELRADFVYMRENEQGKSVQWNKSDLTQTLNDTEQGQWAIYPDISPDANEFVYCEGPDQSNLHLTYLNKKKGVKQIFRLPGQGLLLHPKLSKNTRFIFYSAPGSKGKNTIFFFDRLATVRNQGLGAKEFSLSSAQALDDSEEAYFPRPSSDGNFLVYQRNTQGKKEIILFDRLSNTKKVLAEGMSPSLSFDERFIAFTNKKEGNWNIYRIDRFSSEVIQLTNDSHDEMAPTFRPDNSVVFASNKSGHFELYSLENEAWKTIVSDPTADFYSPQFSGDKKIEQSEKAPFLGNPRSSFGTVAHHGKIYMAGGHQGAEHTYPPESFTDDFHVYDIETNTWSILAPRPRKSHGYQIAAYGDYIYAFGGFAYSENHKPRWKSLDFIDRYHIKENKWETVGTLLTPRSSNAAITIGTKVYLVGGWNGTPKFENDADGIFHKTIEVFDLLTEKIELAPFEIPTPVRRAFTGINLNNEIVLIGGLGEGASHFELIKNVTLINPETGTSRELSPLPFATFAPAAEVLGDELFVFGGMFKMGPMDYDYVSHIYSFNLKTNNWRHTGRYLKETKGFSQVFQLNESTLGVLGGHHYFAGEDRPVTTFETLSIK
jgi:N-acetylneuraminic acid mutarotase